MDQAIADTQALVGAYLRERAGLARLGRTDRVAQVDAELARLGYVDPLPSAPAVAASEPPRGRRAKPRQEESR